MSSESFLSHAKTNLRLAWPVMVSQLGHVMMGVADSVMVGHVDAISLAAASLANVAFNVLLLFGIGVSYAITPLVAEAHGEGDNSKIIDIVRHGFIINVVTSFLLIGLVYVGEQLLPHIGQPSDVVTLSIPFLKIISWSILPIMIFQTFRQFAEGLSITHISMVVVLTCNVINIAINYFLIYGHGGIPALGLVGAGWGTMISRILMAMMMVAWIYYDESFKAFHAVFSWSKYTWEATKKLLNIGVPAGVQFIFEVAAFDFSAVMMGWIGAQTLAAHQIVINMATVSYMITSGLGAAATIRVGYFLGQRDQQNAQKSAYTILVMGLALMSVWALVFISGQHVLPGLYVNDVKVIEIATPLLIIAGLFQLADGTQVICTASLRGMQDVKVPSLLIFAAYWIIGIPLGYWLGFHQGLQGTGIWMGLFIGLSITAGAMFLRFRYMLKNSYDF